MLGPPAGLTARRLAVAAVCAAAATVLDARPAGAELVFFASGRALSVASARQEGDQVVLTLRGGGEMVVPTSAVVDVQADEVPYPPSAADPILVPSVAAGTAPSTQGSAAEALRPHPTYDPLIQRIAEQQGVDPRLVKAVVQVESGYRPRARSPRGAVGLMQVLPATGRQYGRANLYDPSANLQVGVRHLRTLLDRFPVAVALAAYNAGEASVDRFGGIPPFQETTAYVARVLRLLNR